MSWVESHPNSVLASYIPHFDRKKNPVFILALGHTVGLAQVPNPLCHGATTPKARSHVPREVISVSRKQIKQLLCGINNKYN